MVSPEILLKLGFVRVQDAEYHVQETFSLSNSDLQNCFVEKECRRQAICLVLHEYTYKDSTEKWYDVDVYLQEDVGMPVMEVPQNWQGLAVDRLNDLYRFSSGESLPGYMFKVSMHKRKNGIVVIDDPLKDDIDNMEGKLNRISVLNPVCTKDPNTCQVLYCGWPHRCGE